MSRWDIDPPGVRAVLTRVAAHAEDLGTAANSFATDLENCASAIGSSIVTQALSDFAQARAPELSTVATRIENAMTGTVGAVTDYVHGNLAMAANAQSAAAQVPPPRVGGGGPHLMTAK